MGLGKGFADSDQVVSLVKKSSPNQIIWYGTDKALKKPDVLLEKMVKTTLDDSEFIIKNGAKTETVKVNIPGEFNVYNALAAYAAAEALDIKTAAESLAHVEASFGRTEKIKDESHGSILTVNYYDSEDGVCRSAWASVMSGLRFFGSSEGSGL